MLRLRLHFDYSTATEKIARSSRLNYFNERTKGLGNSHGFGLFTWIFKAWSKMFVESRVFIYEYINSDNKSYFFNYFKVLFYSGGTIDHKFARNHTISDEFRNFFRFNCVDLRLLFLKTIIIRTKLEANSWSRLVLFF
jgi:hypothetical protein